MPTRVPSASATACRRLLIMLMFACALAVTVTGVGAPPPAHATGACAGGSGSPCIEWQANFRLANGDTYIGGPAGTHVTILGGGFSAAEGQKISIGLVKGTDILGVVPAPSPTFCSHPHTNTGATATVSGGAFTVSFVWPSGLSVGNWSACAYNATGAIGNTNNAAFYCSSSSRPTVSVTPAEALPGSTVTVTGKGWVPDMNTIVVEILTCDTCSTYIARYGNAISSGSNGVFSVKLKLPATTHTGSYLVWAEASAIPVDTSRSGPHLKVVTSLSPTATPRPKPTATPKPASTVTSPASATATALAETGANSATPTIGPSSIAASGDTPSSGGPSPWLFVAIAIIIALLGSAGGAYYILRRRRYASGVDAH